ncbi:MBL fold metallo-hydrolase [Pseudomonas putida]|uniref:MBL fold metallo-hydrolase n=1 Tax=Pseudomonas putida TaxID=303 RepID=UPI0023639FAB|nr:MBL fold metallo-hydrolase [Pseudomonas putida]MDD1963824.1 MBL fold metallo-hydrolase [Pseudomonas putida]
MRGDYQIQRTEHTCAISVGDIRITAIRESFVDAPSGMLVQGEGLPVPEVPASKISINCFLVETPDALVLIDTGLGGQEAEFSGRLIKELSKLGIKPEDISHVLFTHLHADHFGGAIDEDGVSLFPRSVFVAHPLERDFLFVGKVPSGNEAVMQQFNAAQRLNGVLPQFEWLTPSQVLPGIEMVHLPGHTPGHSGFRIESQGETVLLWGDIVHAPDWQFSDTGIGVSFDVNARLAEETRRNTMRQVAEDEQIIAGTHTDMPGFGRLKASGAGYRFVPLAD